MTKQKRKRGTKDNRIFIFLAILAIVSGSFFADWAIDRKNTPKAVVIWNFSGEFEVLHADRYLAGREFSGVELDSFIESRLNFYSGKTVTRYDNNTFVLEGWGNISGVYPVVFKSGEDKSQLSIHTGYGGSISGEAYEYVIQFDSTNQIIEVEESMYRSWWSETERDHEDYSIHFLIHVESDPLAH